MKTKMILGLLLLSVILCAQEAVAPSIGDGSAGNPYEIATSNNLLWLSENTAVWGMCFIQTADIDAGDSHLINDGAGWSPIGSGSLQFTGSYDGRGHSIQSLYFSRPNQDHTGMFGYVTGGHISGIRLLDVDFLGRTYMGGLLGVAYVQTTVCNCSVTGTVQGSVNVGGLVGMSDHQTIICNCYSQAAGTGSNQVGGFCGLNGWNTGAHMYRCYSTGLVTSGGSYVGGFLSRSGSGDVLDCYWDTEASGISTDIKATPKTTAEMKQQATYTRWNFDALWSIEEGVSYPDLSLLVGYPLPTALTTADLTGNGTEADPYLLSNADELNVMRQALSAWYVLDADIDLSPTVVWNNGLGWEAAGTAATPFTGHFNGNGHTLDGLAVCRPQTDYQGLFGYTQNAVLDGMELSACNVLAKQYTGSLVGHALSGSISDVSVSGIIDASYYGGGIAGELDSGTMQQSRADVRVRARMQWAGCIVGNLNSTGALSGLIDACSSLGQAESQSLVGGIAGQIAWGTVQDCYSHAAVRGNQVGGLIGSIGNSSPGYVTRCYSTGSVVLVGTWSGGLAGQVLNGSIADSYWDMQTSGITTSSGVGVQGLNTADMTYPGDLAYFTGWDFDATWQHDTTGGQNAGYPYLAWQAPTAPDAVQNLTIAVNDGLVLLSWQASAQATCYNIYTSNDPSVPYESWTYLDQSTETQYQTTAADKGFYLVRAVAE